MNDDVQVVLILAMVFAFLALARGGRMSRRQRALQQTVADLQSAQQAAPAVLPGPSQEQFERIEERLRVLERIVTDKGYSLAAEIEALRDAPREKSPATEERAL